MQTIAEWLGTLPEPHRSRALANCADTQGAVAYSLGDAVERHATWCATPQGHDYWRSVCLGDYSAEPATPDRAQPRAGASGMTTADMQTIEEGLRKVESDLCALLDSGRATPIEALLVRPILAAVGEMRGRVSAMMLAMVDAEGGGE